MKLIDLGYNAQLEAYRVTNQLSEFEIGRIVAEHKERYIVKTEKGEVESEITGNLRYSAKSRIDFPAVGDWVAISIFESDFSIIHQILPRFSIISRQAVGQFGEIQIIATNVDAAFIVQAVDRDFNLNRLERYLTICISAKVKPIIVLTKTDLITDEVKSEIIDRIKHRIKNISIFAISNETLDGYLALKQTIENGKTYGMLGSSGVGKSTLVNNLSGNSHMKTNTISLHTNKGRHVTSHRELIALETGGILIDNPGMREVGVVDHENGLEVTFESISELAKDCKFNDCTHTNEFGCAVNQAIENGKLDSQAFENFLKMEKEKTHFEASLVERRKKDKEFGKMIKNFKKDRSKDKY